MEFISRPNDRGADAGTDSLRESSRNLVDCSYNTGAAAIERVTGKSTAARYLPPLTLQANQAEAPVPNSPTSTTNLFERMVQTFENMAASAAQDLERQCEKQDDNLANRSALRKAQSVLESVKNQDTQNAGRSVSGLQETLSKSLRSPDPSTDITSELEFHAQTCLGDYNRSAQASSGVAKKDAEKTAEVIRKMKA